MAFYPDVYPGDKAIKTASEENSLRHILNAGDGMSDRSSGHGRLRDICVGVYNATEDDIPAGAAVRIDDKATTEPFPVRLVDNRNKEDEEFYGVLKTPLAPNAVGSMIVSGVVKLRTQAWPFATPKEDLWESSDTKGLRVINPGRNGWAVVLVGDIHLPPDDAFKNFCKTLTNFCYIDGDKLIMTDGRIGMAKGRASWWGNKQGRIFDLSALGAKTLYAYAYMISHGHNVKFALGYGAPPVEVQVAKAYIKTELCSVSSDKKNFWISQRVHAAGDIIFSGHAATVKYTTV